MNLCARNRKSFSAKILKIGINPYVLVPEDILNSIFEQVGKNKGAIPIRGIVNGKPFKQTLVKYQGAWRLYIHGIMREAAGIDVGDQVDISLEFDPLPRVEPVPHKLRDALDKNKSARVAFEMLTPSRRKEILRYLNSMKMEESLARNVQRVIKQLSGQKPDGIRRITSRSK